MRHLKGFIAIKGLTQWKVARDVGIEETRLSKLITGRLKPAPEEIDKLAAYLNVPAALLRPMPIRAAKGGTLLTGEEV